MPTAGPPQPSAADALNQAARLFWAGGFREKLVTVPDSAMKPLTTGFSVQA
jgi:hypothetical protein